MANAAMADTTETGDDDEGAGADAGAADTGAEGGETKPTVLLTVMDNHDGTFTLHKGDEPDESAGDDDADAGEGAAAGGAEEGGDEDEAAGGAGSGAEGEAGEGDEEDEGETFDGPGPLLKGILDIVKEAQESEGGEGSADDQFDAGYNADKEPTATAAPPMRQKHPSA